MNCRMCGACCASPVATDVYVTLKKFPSQDIQRLENASIRSGNKLLTKIDTRGECVCGALEGELGRDVRCSIYDARPDVCREFAVGGSSCLTARRELNITT